MLLTASLCPPVSETLLFLWYDKLWHSAAPGREDALGERRAPTTEEVII